MATKKKAAAKKAATPAKKAAATKTAESKPGRSSFPPGALDKSGRHVRTKDGWVPVKGNEKLVDMTLEINKGKQIKQPKEKKAQAAKAK